MRQSLLCLALLVLLITITVSPLTAQESDWFAKATEEVGLEGIKGFRIYVSDVNNDNYPDLLLENGLFNRDQLSLYLNQQNPESTDPSDRIFVDFTEESGINANRDPNIDGRVADIAALADLDNDGDVDLVTGTYYHRIESYTDLGDRCEVLLNNSDGTFAVRTDNGLDALGLINVTGLSFLDYDLDGNIDLYMATWSIDHTQGFFTHDYLMKGNGDGSFTNVTVGSGINTVQFPMYGANAIDWNNDGWPDVLASPYCRSGGNLWMNNGDGTFTDVADAIGYNAQTLPGDGGQPLCQWEALPKDFDNDGDMDILQVLVHGGLDAGEGRTVLAINKGPEESYTLEWDMSRIKRGFPRSPHLGDQDAGWFDMDNDGLVDMTIAQSVYVPATDRLYVLKQDGQGIFQDVTVDLRMNIKTTHTIEPLDFDLDGDDDLLVAQGDDANDQLLTFFRNDIGNRNNWIAVKLDAPEGVNRNAIGARIIVHTGNIHQMQELQAGRGHFGGQQPLIQNIGIGTSTTIDSITVHWPSTTQPNTVVYSPQINQMITINAEGNASSAPSLDATISGLELFPNPALDRIEIRLPAPTALTGTIGIYNTLGQLIKTVSVNSASHNVFVAVDDIPEGYYFLRYTAKSMATHIIPFMKSNQN